LRWGVKVIEFEFEFEFRHGTHVAGTAAGLTYGAAKVIEF
jgi:hypothetical protein